VKLVVGQPVGLPCRVEPCGFPGESLVTIALEGERIAGFVRNEMLDGSTLRAVIRAVDERSVTLGLPGAFFVRATDHTTLGAAWARDHLRPLGGADRG
jgi:hypothetical protein